MGRHSNPTPRARATRRVGAAAGAIAATTSIAAGPALPATLETSARPMPAAAPAAPASLEAASTAAPVFVKGPTGAVTPVGTLLVVPDAASARAVAAEAVTALAQPGQPATVIEEALSRIPGITMHTLPGPFGSSATAAYTLGVSQSGSYSEIRPRAAIGAVAPFGIGNTLLTVSLGGITRNDTRFIIFLPRLDFTLDVFGVQSRLQLGAGSFGVDNGNLVVRGPDFDILVRTPFRKGGLEIDGSEISLGRDGLIIETGEIEGGADSPLGRVSIDIEGPDASVGPRGLAIDGGEADFSVTATGLGRGALELDAGRASVGPDGAALVGPGAGVGVRDTAGNSATVEARTGSLSTTDGFTPPSIDVRTTSATPQSSDPEPDSAPAAASDSPTESGAAAGADSPADPAPAPEPASTTDSASSAGSDATAGSGATADSDSAAGSAS
ncbi:hypothetical protein [Tsukamurella paurometabola]|uniref:Uncharacterized protein n=1 Tax=Tsukamurella paurometabola TaxID=2061 RepID=A0A3P8JW40_TSUPA|nr:hypothetical protein [Tsukamurella paurometabola]UEA84498.1 MSCRAMM family adhesin SdrC [Tsukamurella paurometabola]VDR37064.1 Uncharacterised protein [Tsukamurella paurometabola]